MAEENVKLPDDFKWLLKGLGNETSFTVALLLMQRGGLAFEDIVDAVEWRTKVVADHIKQMELGGIVQCYLDGSGAMTYRVTPFGAEMCSSLLNAFNEYYAEVGQKLDSLEVRSNRTT